MPQELCGQFGLGRLLQWQGVYYDHRGASPYQQPLSGSGKERVSPPSKPHSFRLSDVIYADASLNFQVKELRKKLRGRGMSDAVEIVA